MPSIGKMGRMFCWELVDAADPLLPEVRNLYEAALDEDERVPWEWLERGVKSRAGWRPGDSGRHLIVAASQPNTSDPADLAGFVFCVHLPGYGGYLSYVAVADRFRGRGVGTRLYEQAFNVLAVDASAVDEPLPFVIWESCPPEPDDGPESHTVWAARTRLFHKAGGYWVNGVTLPSPNWMDAAAPRVPLQLFLAPIDTPREKFDTAAVKAAVAGLLERVYKAGPGDPEWDGTLPPGCHPRLRPAAAAGQRLGAVR
ncbi:MAG: GNAT family N-acetyltransferase [Fimbriiglobus sp.]|nr:GNAT family N-acetyltransferase [Fimbriiglobus sp.]